MCYIYIYIVEWGININMLLLIGVCWIKISTHLGNTFFYFPFPEQIKENWML